MFFVLMVQTPVLTLGCEVNNFKPLLSIEVLMLPNGSGLAAKTRGRGRARTTQWSGAWEETGGCR